MAGHLAQLVLLALTFASVDGVFNETFCKERMADYDKFKKGTIPPVFFSDNFHLFAEVKTFGTTEYLEEYFSEQYEKAFYSVKVKDGGVNLWLFAQTDELIVDQKGDVCEEEFLVNSSRIVNFIDIQKLQDGSVSLPTPTEIDRTLHWWYPGTKNLIPRGSVMLPDRGIPAVLYESCEYRQEHDATSVTQWYFSDPDRNKTVMPERPNDQVLLMAKVFVEDDEHFWPAAVLRTSQYDFTRFTDEVTETDKHFELPADNLCVHRPSAEEQNHPVPNIPNDFYFKSEQIVTPRDKPKPHPSLHSVTEGFYADFNISLVTAQENEGTRTQWLHVTDFFNGLQYTIDTNIGHCDVEPIETDDLSAKNLGKGSVRMRSPNGFFNLESDKYEYMGVHRHLERGIECDVWSAYFMDGGLLPNALYTWYFATEEWRSSHELDNKMPLPVSLKITAEDEMLTMNVFEFTTNVKFLMPDVSVCFSPALTKNVRFTLDAFYDKAVKGNTQNFHNALVKRILDVTGLASVIRLSELKVYPNTKGIAVEFKLLDRRPERGDVDAHVHQKTNLQAVEALRVAIKSGAFIVAVEEFNGMKSVKAVKESFELIDPRYKPPTATTPGKDTSTSSADKVKTTGIPRSDTSTSSVDKGKTTGIPRSDTSTSSADKVKTTGIPRSDTSTSSVGKEGAGSSKDHGDDEKMYSPGEMAGLAVGMIFLTAIVVALGLFIYKRIPRKESTEYLTMDKRGSQ